MRPFTHLPGLLRSLLPIFAFVALTVASPVANSEPPNPLSGLLAVVEDITDAGAKLPGTPKPSPHCAAVNGGELQCCRAAVAGDLQLIVLLAAGAGYSLTPDDINGLDCDNNIATCPGVELCCKVTGLSPLLSLYCQQY